MNTRLEALGVRRVLAFAGTFTDTDGDTYAVTLTGPGTVTLDTLDDVNDGNPATGFIAALNVQGTTAASKFSISVAKAVSGDGRVRLSEGTFGVLRSAKLPAVDVTLSAEFVDVGQLTLGDVNDGTTVNVSIAQSSNNLGARTAAFRNLGDADISFGEFLSSISMNQSIFASFDFSEGARVISSRSDLIARIDAEPTAVFSEMRAAGAFRVRADDLGSDIKLISASDIDRDNNHFFKTTGAIASIICKNTNNGIFIARNFGKISGAAFTGSLSAAEPDAKGNTFASIRFTGEVSGDILLTNGGTPGRIASLSGGSMNGASILAGSIGTLRVLGDVTNGSTIGLTQTSGVLLRSMAVGGVISGFTLDISQAGGVGSLTAKRIFQSDFDVGFISSLRVSVGPDGGLQSTSFEFAAADAQGFALRTANFGESLINAGVIIAPGATGRFGAITARRYESVTITAATIGSLIATGTPGQLGEVLVDSQITAKEAPPEGFSIGTLDLRGSAFLTVVRAAGSINRISIAEIPANDLEFDVVAGSDSFVFDFPADLNGLLPTARINRITVTRPFVSGTPTFSGGFFLAPAIGDVTINGLINTTGANDGQGPFGFGARVFGKVTLKDASGQTIKPVLPGAPAIFNPFLPGDPGNFQIRVYV